MPCLSFSQDVDFSILNGNLLYLNPAFTGTSESLRMGTSGVLKFRLKNNESFVTNVFADQYLNKNNGIGITYIHEDYNFWRNMKSFHLNYARQIWIGKRSVLSVGVKGGLIKSKYGYSSNVNADGGIGLLYYNKHVFASYSISRINKSTFNKDMFGSWPKHNVFIGGNLNIRKVKISPQIRLDNYLSDASGLALLKVGYKSFIVGAAYRTDETYYGIIGVKIKSVTLNYSYDFSERKQSPYAVNTHEFSLQLLLNTLKNKNERALNIF